MKVRCWSYVTVTRDEAAVLRFMKKALRHHGSPEVITTDGVRPYRAAMDELGNTGKREWAAMPTIGWRTPTCPSHDGSVRRCDPDR
jgi:transposase-like protein